MSCHCLSIGSFVFPGVLSSCCSVSVSVKLHLHDVLLNTRTCQRFALFKASYLLYWFLQVGFRAVCSLHWDFWWLHSGRQTLTVIIYLTSIWFCNVIDVVSILNSSHGRNFFAEHRGVLRERMSSEVKTLHWHTKVALSILFLPRTMLQCCSVTVSHFIPLASFIPCWSVNKG